MIILVGMVMVMVMVLQFLKHARFYSLTMKKLLKSSSYVEKEFNRLERMVESGKILPEKVAEFRLRQSIVNSFRPGFGDADDLEHEL